MDWIALILAGLFEIFGVLMINKLHKDRNWQSLLLLILGFGARFILLAYSMETLPMGTAYAIWTGIGASGGAILGMIFYGECYLHRYGIRCCHRTKTCLIKELLYMQTINQIVFFRFLNAYIQVFHLLSERNREQMRMILLAYPQLWQRKCSIYGRLNNKFMKFFIYYQSI